MEILSGNGPLDDPHPCVKISGPSDSITEKTIGEETLVFTVVGHNIADIRVVEPDAKKFHPHLLPDEDNEVVTPGKVYLIPKKKTSAAGLGFILTGSGIDCDHVAANRTNISKDPGHLITPSNNNFVVALIDLGAVDISHSDFTIDEDARNAASIEKLHGVAPLPGGGNVARKVETSCLPGAKAPGLDDEVYCRSKNKTEPPDTSDDSGTCYINNCYATTGKGVEADASLDGSDTSALGTREYTEKVRANFGDIIMAPLLTMSILLDKVKTHEHIEKSRKESKTKGSTNT